MVVKSTLGSNKDFCRNFFPGPFFSKTILVVGIGPALNQHIFRFNIYLCSKRANGSIGPLTFTFIRNKGQIQLFHDRPLKVKCLPTPIAQSICTHYSCFENMGRFVTLKRKKISKIWVAKSKVQKTGPLLSKIEEAALPLLFLNNEDPVFCTLIFATHILDLFF